jgi:hypothetical protein
MNKVISHIHYIYIEYPLLKKKFWYKLFIINFYFNSSQYYPTLEKNISYEIIFTFNMFYTQIVFLQH